MTPNKRLLLGATLSLCVLSCGPATTEPADNQATETPDMSKATCDTDPAHDRCSASPDTYNDWSPSSIVSEMFFRTCLSPKDFDTFLNSMAADTVIQ